MSTTEFPPEKAHLGKWTPPYDIFFRVTVSIQHVDITLNRLGKKFLFADLNKIIFAFQVREDICMVVLHVLLVIHERFSPHPPTADDRRENGGERLPRQCARKGHVWSITRLARSAGTARKRVGGVCRCVQPSVYAEDSGL